jgi:hypothetical protein
MGEEGGSGVESGAFFSLLVMQFRAQVVHPHGL